MSWQAYVDNNLVGTKMISKGAIYGLDGGKWAATPGLNITQPEALKFIAAFKDPTAIRTSGVFLGNIKYFAQKCDDRSIYGKQGANGVVLVKTVQCVLVGIYDDKIQPGQAATTVERLADYLIEQGY